MWRREQRSIKRQQLLQQGCLSAAPDNKLLMMMVVVVVAAGWKSLDSPRIAPSEKREIDEVINRYGDCCRSVSLAYSWYVYQTYIIFNFTYCTVRIMVYFASTPGLFLSTCNVEVRRRTWGRSEALLMYAKYEYLLLKMDRAPGQVEMRK